MDKKASARLGLVLVGSLCACGGSPQPGPGATDQHPELVQTFPVMPGTCGVSRSITLLKTDLTIDRIERSRVGFVAAGVHEATREPGWLSLSVDGVSQRLSFSGWKETRDVLANFPFAESLTELHPVLLTSDGPSTARLLAWPLDKPGTNLNIGAHFARGTTRTAFASARDGKHGVFAADHPGVFAPHIVPVERHGADLGWQFALDEGSAVCVTIAPSQDSFAVGVVYSQPDAVLKVIAPGYNLATVSRPLSSTSCPLLQFDDLLLIAAVVDDVVRFFVVASGEILPMLANGPRLADIGSLPLWFTRRPQDGLWVLVRKMARRSWPS